MPGSQPVRAVCFDIGETLVDATRHWQAWADWLGVPSMTFFAVLGAVIERGEHHQRVFELLRPGFDLEAEREKRRAARGELVLEARDFYPDALPCLARLRADGYQLGLVGNQPASTEARLAELGVEVDWIASSGGWGVAKPAPEFFARVAECAGLPPQEIAYVGDRLDNDVLPARAAGMVAVFLRRGPWGFLHATRPDVACAQLRIESLDELPTASSSAAPGGAK